MKPIVYKKCPYDDSNGMFSSDSSQGMIDNLYVIDRNGSSSSNKPTPVVYNKPPYSGNSDYDSDGASDESEFFSQNSKEDVESDDENNESGDIAKEIEENHNTLELPATILTIKDLCEAVDVSRYEMRIPKDIFRANYIPEGQKID